MSNTEVQIPDGMMKAVESKFPDREMSDVHIVTVKGVLEAALRWLSENPILPTAEQLYSTIGKLPVAMCDIVWTERDRAMIAEWQRIMFLAPEPEVPCFFDTPFGRFEVDNRVPPGEIRLHNWNGPTLIKNIKTEPEVPEKIADLSSVGVPVGGKGSNLVSFAREIYKEIITEAFRRGQRSK